MQEEDLMRKELFGEEFKWGVTISAFQNEGSARRDGKGMSIWDTFVAHPSRIKTGESIGEACDFYHRYPEDIALARQLHFDHFGFSVSWSRIFPEGVGKVNDKGLDFYDRVVDAMLEQGVTPWATLYHWDLPQALENKGGWANREMLHWFGEYVDTVTRRLGDRVKNYKVLNEPSAFCGFGYMTGEHAPGTKNMLKYLAATHHANLAQGIGGRLVRQNVKDSHVGTSFATFCIHPYSHSTLDVRAAKVMDALINRNYIEPLVGMGYPYQTLPALHLMDMYIKSEDEANLPFEFDFIGIQYYCRLIGQFRWWPLFAWAGEVPASKRGVPMNNMGFEIYPEGMYEILKRYDAYPMIHKLLVTENGVCLDDALTQGRVHDPKRIQFYKDYLSQLLRAKREGVRIEGFFCWTLMDNFEWAEGYKARFGLVYVDHSTQQRVIKDSGYWMQRMLQPTSKSQLV